MVKVVFKSSEAYQAQVQRIFPKIKEELLGKFPAADVQEIGGTAVPGLLTKGDLDISLRVSKEDFPKVTAYLKKHYRVHQKHNWNEAYASFVADDKYELPLGIQLTIKGHKEDRFIAQRDKLKSRPDLIKQYNQLKMSYQNADMETYRKAKWKFIEQYLQ